MAGEATFRMADLSRGGGIQHGTHFRTGRRDEGVLVSGSGCLSGDRSPQGPGEHLEDLQPEMKNIEVVREYDRQAATICAYAGELNQVWTNLIDNAIDAMDGKGRLTIRTAADADGIKWKSSTPEQGIPPDVTPRIFRAVFHHQAGWPREPGWDLDITYRIVTIAASRDPFAWTPFREIHVFKFAYRSVNQGAK